MKLATAERKTHWSDVDTGGYNALDLTLHNSHGTCYINTNVFKRPLGPVGIYHLLLYNLYSGARVPYVPNVIIITNNNKYIVNVLLVYVGLTQARPNNIILHNTNL